MGLFDILKKRSQQNKNNTVNDQQQTVQLTPEIEYNTMPNGHLRIEFYDKNKIFDFKESYDTTRLIVGSPLDIEGHKVYKCAVSWYGYNDYRIPDEKIGELDSIESRQYKVVLAEIDLQLLQNDQNYCEIVMRELLDKQRVERFLEEGLQEDSKRPCGKYIGGVKKTEEKGYEKVFFTEVGQVSHNSKWMQKKRRKIIESEKTQLEVEKAKLEAEKAKLEVKISQIKAKLNELDVKRDKYEVDDKINSEER